MTASCLCSRRTLSTSIELRGALYGAPRQDLRQRHRPKGMVADLPDPSWVCGASSVAATGFLPAESVGVAISLGNLEDLSADSARANIQVATAIGRQRRDEVGGT